MEELDLRGLKCPLPALMARKRLAPLPPGETLLRCWPSDPLVGGGHSAHVPQEGHAVIERASAAGQHRFLIRQARLDRRRRRRRRQMRDHGARIHGARLMRGLGVIQHHDLGIGLIFGGA